MFSFIFLLKQRLLGRWGLFQGSLNSSSSRPASSSLRDFLWVCSDSFFIADFALGHGSGPGLHRQVKVLIRGGVSGASRLTVKPQLFDRRSGIIRSKQPRRDRMDVYWGNVCFVLLVISEYLTFPPHFPQTMSNSYGHLLLKRSFSD